MEKLRYVDCPRLTLPIFSLILLLVLSAHVSVVAQAPKTNAAAAAGTPSDAVRRFYKGLGEKRFRETVMATALRPAIEGLSTAELEELRPYFEKIAEDAGKIQITGEQISGDRASVFVKLAGDEPGAPPVELQLRRVSGQWVIIFNEEVERTAKREGGRYFFRERIQTQEQAAEAMLVRIASAELVYQQSRGGKYTDLATLVKERLLPPDVAGPESAGYRFHVTLSADGKSYTAGAEPAVYGRTGMRSFFMDPTGIKSADTGGKPYAPAPAKKN